MLTGNRTSLVLACVIVTMFADVEVEEGQERYHDLYESQACLRAMMSIRAIARTETENQT
jgi:hypothetical protein